MQASGISYQGMFPSIHRRPINQPSIKNTVENANGNLAKKYCRKYTKGCFAQLVAMDNFCSIQIQNPDVDPTFVYRRHHCCALSRM